MEKFENMKQNMVSDDDLDQISGGRNFFDAFTAEFRGKAGKATTLQFDPESEDNDYGISTLEMRANPNKKKKSEKIVKL